MVQKKPVLKEHKAGYVILFAVRALLEGMTAPATLVSWRSHRGRRAVTSASAAEAMCLSEAIAQSDCVRALWRDLVLGLNLRERQQQENVPPFKSVTDSQKGKYDHSHNETGGPSEDRVGAVDLAITREDLTRPHRCSCGAWMEKRKWPTPKPSFMAMETCCELCVVKLSWCWSRHQRHWLPDFKKNESGKGYRESSHPQSCGSLWTKRQYL